MVGEPEWIQRTVIGLFGNKQHGKDTLCKLIAKHARQQHHQRTRSFALADPVKYATMALTGMPIEVAAPSDYDKPKDEDTNALRMAWTYRGRNGREWLQWVGTELGREQIGDTIWIDRAVNVVIDDDEGTHVFLITDCRFYNEREELKRQLEARMVQFVRVRIKRPGEPVDISHRSESEVASMTDSMFDHVIVNDAGLFELDEQAFALVEKLWG